MPADTTRLLLVRDLKKEWQPFLNGKDILGRAMVRTLLEKLLPIVRNTPAYNPVKAQFDLTAEAKGHCFDSKGLEALFSDVMNRLF